VKRLFFLFGLVLAGACVAAPEPLAIEKQVGERV
jgi:hypothetical protein